MCVEVDICRRFLNVSYDVREGMRASRLPKWQILYWNRKELIFPQNEILVAIMCRNLTVVFPQIGPSGVQEGFFLPASIAREAWVLLVFPTRNVRIDIL